MELVVLAFIALWSAYGIYGPVVHAGVRNRHNALWVEYNEYPGRNDNNHQPSVFVQERGEWRLCKIVGVISGLVALGASLAIPASTVTVFVLVLLTVMSDSFFRLTFILDSAGHGAEIIAAEKDYGIVGYRDQEVERLIGQKDWQKPLGLGVAGVDQLQDQISREKVIKRLQDTKWLAEFVYRIGSYGSIPKKMMK